MKHRLERRYTMGMVGVSYGKPLNLFSSHTELGSRELSSPDSFGGGAREDPLAHRLSRVTRHRNVEFILFSNAQIEIGAWREDT